jgi:hypothetical protein
MGLIWLGVGPVLPACCRRDLLGRLFSWSLFSGDVSLWIAIPPPIESCGPDWSVARQVGRQAGELRAHESGQRDSHHRQTLSAPARIALLSRFSRLTRAPRAKEISTASAKGISTGRRNKGRHHHGAITPP